MSDNPTVPVPKPNPDRRRVSRSDYDNLVREVAILSKELARMQMKVAEVKPEETKLPMSKEYFIGLAILSTLQSGGWQQLKYIEQRAGQAYEAWAKACGVELEQPMEVVG